MIRLLSSCLHSRPSPPISPIPHNFPPSHIPPEPSCLCKERHRGSQRQTEKLPERGRQGWGGDPQTPKPACHGFRPNWPIKSSAGNETRQWPHGYTVFAGDSCRHLPCPVFEVSEVCRLGQARGRLGRASVLFIRTDGSTEYSAPTHCTQRARVNTTCSSDSSALNPPIPP